jgi:polyisoprenoid-binding protein YceI
MRHRVAFLVAAAVFAGTLAATDSEVHAEKQAIDAEHSTLTVFVNKSGLFSAFADNHVIRAPISAGSISENAPLSIELTVRAADLRVLDPGVAADRRAEVQARMLGPEVLDVAKFPEMAFASTTVAPSGTDRWLVTGRLTIRGQGQTITFAATRVSGRYHGEVTIKQHDFGIEPIKVAGGAVKVKDELKVQFDIAR